MDRINISEVLDTGSIPVSGTIIKKLSEYKFNFERIKKDVLDIIERYNLPEIGLTHSSNTIESSGYEKVIEGVGSKYNYGKGVYIADERDYSIFNEEFKSTSLYEMYQSIPNVGRFRIMNMESGTCYPFHSDRSKRYHYVIDTNPECFFLFPEYSLFYHIPCDENLYIVNTQRKHTFINGGRKRRTHLILNDMASFHSK